MAVKKLNDKYIVLTNVIFMWPKVQEPATKYQSTELEYSVECVIDDETKKELTKLKLNKQFKDASEKYEEYDGMWLFKATQNVLTSTGKELRPPFVIHPDKTTVQETVGNGSTGQIKLFCMEGAGVSKGKINIKLNGLLIEDLKVYEGNDAADGFDLDDTSSGGMDEDDDLAF